MNYNEKAKEISRAIEKRGFNVDEKTCESLAAFLQITQYDEKFWEDSAKMEEWNQYQSNTSQ